MSWEELQAILEEGHELHNNPAPIVACWVDGTPLEPGPNGELFCPACGWQPGCP